MVKPVNSSSITVPLVRPLDTRCLYSPNAGSRPVANALLSFIYLTFLYFLIFSCLCSSLDVCSILFLVYFWVASFFCSARTGYQPKVNILLFMHITLCTACCLSYCWCCRWCSMLLNLHTRKSCAALLLLVLCVYAVLGRLAVCRWTAASAA